MIYSVSRVCARLLPPFASPCINSRCAMSFRGIQRGVPFLWFHVRTEQRLSEARDTRSSARGAAATRHERVPLSILRSTGVSPVKEKREKGKVANRFFPFIVTFAHTPAWEKLFPFSFHRVLRVYRVNERILSRFNFSHRSVGNSFRPFFFSLFPFFFFSFFREPRIQGILDFRHRITARIQTDLSRPSFRYKTWIFLAAIN